MPTLNLIDGPQLVGTLNGQLADYHRSYGPIAYGGALWMFPLTTNDPTGDVDLLMKVYKSTDGGLTWVQQDHAHAPQMWIAGGLYWDGSVSVVTILSFLRMGGSQRTVAFLVDFDMSTGLFGATYGTLDFNVVPSGVTGLDTDAFIKHAHLFKLSNGSFRVVYTDYFAEFFPNNEQAQVSYRDFNGSSWSAPVLLPGDNTIRWGDQTDVEVAVQDGDVIHVVLGYADISSNPDVINGHHSQYVQIAADGSFSTPLDLHSVLLTALGASTLFENCNTAVLSGNNILIPVWTDNGGADAVGVLVGTPKSAPSFTYVPVGSFASSGLNDLVFAPADLKIAHIGTQDVVAWVGINSGTNNASFVYQSASSDHGATWTSPAQILSLDSTPPAPVSGQDTLNINTISLGALADGSLGLAFTSWAAYYVALAPVALSLSCGSPPSAQVGVAYSHAIPATGGTGPYTFAITGSLPAGLSLDPATGIISGTPLADSSSFNILHLDPTTHNDEGAAIDSFWETGLVRGVSDFTSRMIRVGALDIWIRGNGTLITTVFGPDKTQSLAPQLLSASGVPATLSPDPGIMYQEKFDLAHVENYTVRVGTNAIDAWWELSEIVGYARQDLFNR